MNIFEMLAKDRNIDPSFRRLFSKPIVSCRKAGKDVWTLRIKDTTFVFSTQEIEDIENELRVQCLYDGIKEED